MTRFGWITGLFGLLLTSGVAQADLIISEYVEGPSGNNKGLELYSTTGTVDLSQCSILIYANGSSSSNSPIALSGILNQEEVFVVAHGDASFAGVADQTTNALTFNGNDGVTVECNAAIVDSIGQFEVDQNWSSNGVSTTDDSIRRITDACTGDTNFNDAFDPSVNYESAGGGEYGGLGSHTASCAPDTTNPTVDAVVPETTGPTAKTNISFTVVFSETVNGFGDPGDVTVNHSGTNHTDVSFSAASGTQFVVTVNGITGTGTLSLTVNSNAVEDNAMLMNNNMLTSADVQIDPNAVSLVPAGLLISEISVRPDGAEFVEIFNNSGETLTLSDVYLTDATFAGGSVYYYQIVNGAGGGGGFDDFHARFPDGATIAAGEYQTIALQGSGAFEAVYSAQPTYELYDDSVAGTATAMREAVAGSINGQGAFSDGEMAVLYYWDGSTDLVTDLDYTVWGDKNEAVDKSGVTIDGPDGDAVVSGYANETAIADQSPISVNAHPDGQTWQRIDNAEGTESQVSGNGADGSDETSEPLRITWGAGSPTPGAASDGNIVLPVLINEVNAVAEEANEFIELYSTDGGDLPLDGVIVVFYNDAEQSYATIDMVGLATNGSGYAIIGGSNTAPDALLPTMLLDGPAAIAVYQDAAANFPNGTAVTTTNLIDAVVYESGQGSDAGLLVLLENGESIVNEDANGLADTESLQRCPNGSGGRRMSGAFTATTPTPDALNNACPLGDYYANVDDSNATVLRSTLHDTIDDHQWFPYSASETDTWDILEMADEDPNNASNVLDVYRNESYAKAGGGNSNYNREHTWPRSVGLGDTGTTNNTPATDAHNLRISNIGYNSDRGSMLFDYCDPSDNGDCTELVTVANDGVGGVGGAYPADSNWYTASSDGNAGMFEVWSDRRGDVARTIFYMDIRFEGGSHGVTGAAEPNLEITDTRAESNTSSGNTWFLGMLSTLLEWHAADPIDDKERVRNEAVFSFQGNRNPFVDHPEWVDCLYASVCGTGVIFADGFESN